jgi:hypothetical protein
MHEAECRRDRAGVFRDQRIARHDIAHRKDARIGLTRHYCYDYVSIGQHSDDAQSILLSRGFDDHQKSHVFCAHQLSGCRKSGPGEDGHDGAPTKISDVHFQLPQIDGPRTPESHAHATGLKSSDCIVRNDSVCKSATFDPVARRPIHAEELLGMMLKALLAS